MLIELVNFYKIKVIKIKQINYIFKTNLLILSNNRTGAYLLTDNAHLKVQYRFVCDFEEMSLLLLGTLNRVFQILKCFLRGLLLKPKIFFYTFHYIVLYK